MTAVEVMEPSVDSMREEPRRTEFEARVPPAVDEEGHEWLASSPCVFIFHEGVCPINEDR